MIVIRLQRGGKKKEPHYRVVAMDKKKATTAQAKEILGHFHPCDKENQITINMERVEYWLSVGAKPSETVEDLIKKAKGEKPLVRKHQKVSKKAKEKEVAKAKAVEEAKNAPTPEPETPAEPKAEETPQVEEKQPEPQPQPQPEPEKKPEA